MLFYSWNKGYSKNPRQIKVIGTIFDVSELAAVKFAAELRLGYNSFVVSKAIVKSFGGTKALMRISRGAKDHWN